MKKEKIRLMSLFLASIFCLCVTNYSTDAFFEAEKLNIGQFAAKNSTSDSETNCSLSQKNGNKQNKSNFYKKTKGEQKNSANINNELPVYQDQVLVYPGGDLIGIDLNTKGVICVDFSGLETPSGAVPSPAKEAGILSSDVITHIDGQEVNTADEFENILSRIPGETCEITLEREEVIITVNTKIYLCTDNVKRIGLWVRDNVMGLGTLSFITSDKKSFAALGHPISDASTGITVPVKDGELIGAEVLGVIKGRKNHPGEIKGMIRKTDKLKGKINTNTSFGIFGEIHSEELTASQSLVPLGRQEDVRTGEAFIITTVDNEKKIYSVCIEEVNKQTSPSVKSMKIRVTDPELLEKTGGIIQGMSGSPVIQDGKLIGAVTHVLTSDPTRGYAIFSEWMLEKCSGCHNMTASCKKGKYNQENFIQEI